MLTIPEPTGRCAALKRTTRPGDGPSAQCSRAASTRGVRHLCTQHRDKLLADPEWPLVAALDPHRVELRARLLGSSASSTGVVRGEPRPATGSESAGTEPDDSMPGDGHGCGVAAPDPLPRGGTGGNGGSNGADPPDARKPDSQEPQRDPLGALARLVEMKVLGSVVILAAAFASEFLFLAPFGVDFSFFLGTVDTIPLFVRNLSGILVFSAIVFLGIAVVIVLALPFFSINSGIKARREELQREERRRLALREEELASLRTRMAERRDKRTGLERRQREVAEQIRRIDRNPRASYLARAATGSFFKALLTRLASRLGEAIAKTRGAPDRTSADAEREWLHEERRSLFEEASTLIERIRELREEQVRDDAREREISTAIEKLRKLTRGPWLTLVRPAFSHFSRQLNDTFVVGPVPRLMTRRWAQVLFLACITGIPLASAYYDGKTMAACVRSIDDAGRDKVTLACPEDGRARWDAEPGGRLPADTSADAIAAWWFAGQREPLRLVARNHPVVTVAFKDAPNLLRRDAAASDAACVRTADSAGRCALIRDRASARMLYLGEAGSWILLHGLGAHGEPLYVRTTDVASISLAPVDVVRRAPANTPPVQVSVDAQEDVGGGHALEMERVRAALAADLQRVRKDLFMELEHTRVESGTELERLSRTGAEATRRLDALGERLDAWGANDRRMEVQLSLDSVQFAALSVIGAGLTGASARPGTPPWPAKLLGVEARVPPECLREPPAAAVAFPHGAVRLPASEPGLRAALRAVVEKLADPEATTGPPMLLIVEGTADSTGSPAVNVDVSEARATFVHHRLQAALARPGGDAPPARVRIASFGSGEWHALPGDETLPARGALIRICRVAGGDPRPNKELARR